MIGLLKGSGGNCDQFWEIAKKSKKPGGSIILNSDPKELVKQVYEEIDSKPSV